MVGRCGFVTQQIAVGTRIEQALVAFTAAFSHGQGDGAVGEVLADVGNNCAEALVGEPGVFATLENEGAEAQLVTFLGACVDVFFGKAITIALAVRFADSAVQAVVLAIIAHFDKAACEDLVAIDFLAYGNGLFGCVFGKFRGIAGNEPLVAFHRKAVVVCEGIYEFKQLRIHGADYSNTIDWRLCASFDGAVLRATACKTYRVERTPCACAYLQCALVGNRLLQYELC